MLSSAENVAALLRLAIGTQSRIENPSPVRNFRKPKDDTRKLVHEQFATLCQLLSALDEKVFITRQVEDQLALLAVARETHTFFYHHLTQLSEAPSNESLHNVSVKSGSEPIEKALDIDTACTIIQTWERAYQSMIRYNYLNEVRQKAADLHTAHKAIDPLKAIVMIQAV
ncbi:hypothetical protein Tcan_12201 [Toxocara canis]|uniref:Uncharacterized protein n=1 Tax=Toxocara canis TaxID=6265 RepID=A0A0B2W3H2_TOXCA|nr:hypothetical protein Tcan_12201 [Toxocara canis]